jgi:lipooligosaccharide transport system permease protein
MREFLRLSARVCHRHLLIYLEDWFANMSPTLIDPIMFILAFGMGLGSHVTSVGKSDYLHFMAPGLTITTALFTAFFETSYGFFIRLRFEGIYKAILTTPVGVDELIAGEFMWVALKGAFMSFGVAMVLTVLGLVKPNFVFLIPSVGAFVAVACGSLGFIASSLVKNINQFQAIYALLISPLFFFSGVFYPVESLPEALRHISKISPLFHGVRIGQEILWSGEIAGAMAKNGSALVLMAASLGFLSYRMIRPKLIA